MTTVWTVRGGGRGQWEQDFIDQKRIVLTWTGLSHDLSGLKAQTEFVAVLSKTYPAISVRRRGNHAGQVRSFAAEMKVGDLVIMPRKGASQLAIGRIKGEYRYEPKGPDPLFYTREVEWLSISTPRGSLDQDIQQSLLAQMTICRIRRDKADLRVLHAVKMKTSEHVEKAARTADEEGSTDEDIIDIEEMIRQRIRAMIEQHYKSHDFAMLVEEVLIAQGYTTFRNPPGPDKGIDILAGTGSLGFGPPRLCVQVKSGVEEAGSSTIHELMGAMQSVKAEQGLFVSWGGFKSSVRKDTAEKFFAVRLWDAKDFIDELLDVYEALDAEVRARLPLVKLWVTVGDDSE